MRHLLLILGIFLSPYQVAAQSDAGSDSFIRFVEGGAQWQGELQTAVTSYRNDAGVEVDLVAAIHIADRDYYQALNDYFAGRDVVLYELVAEADARPEPQPTSNNLSALSVVQQALATFLNVVFQLDHVNYSATNFRHADLSPAQLAEIMAAKNENFFSMFMSLALAQLAAEQAAIASNTVQPSAFTLLTMMSVLAAEDQGAAFKYLFAQELSRSDGVILGAELEQQLTILGDRNRVALDTLEDALTNSGTTSISLFFGAAHMPGLERELIGSLGFEQTGQGWLTAWHIP